MTLDDQQLSGNHPTTAVPRLEQLQQQERVWFAWVCRLHDVHAGAQSAHSAAVLAIARRRWAEARQALQCEAQQRFGDRAARASRPR
jgi:hypothetical protein